MLIEEGVKYKDERLAPFENAKLIKIKMTQNISDNNVVVVIIARVWKLEF